MSTRKLALLIVLSAIILQPHTAFAQTTHDVTVGNNFFSPANLTIQVGDTVRWTNAADGGPPHNVTGNNFASVTAESFNFQHTFTQAGIEDYLCTVHPSTMTGTITVEGGGGNAEADLSLSEISVNNNISYTAGEPIAINTEVTNVGNAASAAYTVNYYVSTDSQITSGDTLFGSSNRPALGAGNDDNFMVSLNLPGGLATGNYFIGGIININDANNANNTNLEDESISVQASGGGGGFALNPGQNGNWWGGASRNGEGVQIEVSNTSMGGRVLVATMYSYSPNGDPIFLLAVGQIVDGEAEVNVFIYRGPSWGANYDPADWVETQWGTGLFTSSGCDQISMTLTPNAMFMAEGYSALSYDLEPLTSSALPCPIQ